MVLSDKIVLACGCDESYFDKGQLYLDTVEKYGRLFDYRYFFHVGWNPVKWSREFDLVRPLHIPGSHITSTLRSNVQQGLFLDFLPEEVAELNPTIVFTDMDMALQRGLTLSEVRWLENWSEGVVGLSYNANSVDTLMNEAYRLELRVDTPERLLQRFPFANQKVYNVGVIVARFSTYRELFEGYKEIWPSFLAVKPPAQGRGVQFVLCNTIHAAGIRVWEMPSSWHSHGHAGLPPKGTKLTYEGLQDLTTGDMVLFKHAM